MEADAPVALARSTRGAMIAPAGCGKTWTLARAVTDHGRGRELILTHTHAGVDAIRRRLQEFGCNSAGFRVDTIAGWSLRLASAFPSTAAIPTPTPRTDDEYIAVYAAAARLLHIRPFQEIVRASYSGVYVDEYQDCTLEQHAVVLALLECLPCRVLGDPLQAIFAFGSRASVTWATDVTPNFDVLQGPGEPRRWSTTNPELGTWLLAVRSRLERGLSVDLRGAPLRWVHVSDLAQLAGEQVKACFGFVGKSDETVVAINKWPQQCHSIAMRLRGTFSCVERMDPPDLYDAAKRIDASSGATRALAVLEFASGCMTSVKTEMKAIRTALETGRSCKSKKHERQRRALEDVALSGGPNKVDAALAALAEIDDAFVYRRELLREMQRACRATSAGEASSLAEASWIVRNRTRQRGRRFARCSMGTTLLVKGLEFDHAIVLNPSDYDAANLYVALTRASKSLTVFSQNPLIQPRCPSAGGSRS